jgi:leucyl/phenylalanyl-tRNA---protein transferase
VSVGAAFMGESMFSCLPDASKVCLVALVERLRSQGYLLHDTQFLTPHLERMGAREITRAAYQRRLQEAIAIPCTFT